MPYSKTAQRIIQILSSAYLNDIWLTRRKILTQVNSPAWTPVALH